MKSAGNNPSQKRGNQKSLPKPNVSFPTSEDSGNMTPEKLRGMVCNPIYAGMGVYPALVDEEMWVRAASQMIKQEGAEQFLVNMLFVLRKSFPDEDEGRE